MSFKKIMISYGRKDASEFVQKINTILVQRGHTVWIDRSKEENNGIDGGKKWEEEIEKAIETHEIVLAILSPHAIRRSDGVCLDEISMARFENKFIIPLMYKEVKPPLCIFRLDWIDFLKSETKTSVMEVALEKLLRSIDNNKLDYEGKNKAFRALRSINFDARLTALKKDFIGRKWIFDAKNSNNESEINSWLESDRKILLILGDPGIGKSAIAAYLIEKHPSCIAYHFCMGDDEDTLNPTKFIKSIAHQLTSQLGDDYADQVLEEMDELPKSPVSLFRTLIANPLSQLSQYNHKKFFIVVDGLDEASKLGSDNELLMLFSSKFIDAIPNNVRFIFTSRDNADIKSRFEAYEPFEIKTTDVRNRDDMKEYLVNSCNKYKLEISPEDIEVLIEKSEGNILYLKEIIRQYNNSRKFDIYNLPRGLDGIYLEFFDSTFGGKECYLPYQEIISLLVALYTPISLEFMEALLEKDVKDLFVNIRSYFPVDGNNNVTVFHKSLHDWLKKLDNKYRVNEYEGHKLIVDTDKLNLQNIHEVKIYLYSATKLFLNKQTNRDQDINIFYEEKILSTFDALIQIDEDNTFMNRLRLLVENYPAYEKNKYNEKYLEKLNSLYAVVDDDIEKSDKNFENLYNINKDKWAEDYIYSLNTSANEYNKQGNKEEAIDIKKKILLIARELYTNDANKWVEIYLHALNGLAFVYRYSENIDQALDLEKESLVIYEELYLENSNQWTQGYIGALNNLAYSYEYAGQNDTANMLFEKILSITSKLFKENSERWGEFYINSLRDLSSNFESMALYKDAANVKELSLKVLKTLYEVDPNKWAEYYTIELSNLAGYYNESSGVSEAAKLMEESLVIRKELYQKNPEHGVKGYTGALNNLAVSYNNINRVPEAIELLEQSLAIQKELYEDNPDQWAYYYTLALNNLAGSYGESNRVPEAIRLIEEGAGILKELYLNNPDRWEASYTMTLNNLSVFYTQIYSRDKVIKLIKEHTSIATRHTSSSKIELQTVEGIIGRNDPCPCGSGKKYKKCCGKNK